MHAIARPADHVTEYCCVSRATAAARIKLAHVAIVLPNGNVVGVTERTSLINGCGIIIGELGLVGAHDVVALVEQIESVGSQRESVTKERAYPRAWRSALRGVIDAAR